MNKESQQVYDYIQENKIYLDKINELKKSFPNIRDFTVMIGYVIMQVVNYEKKFIHLNRKALELPELAIKFF